MTDNCKLELSKHFERIVLNWKKSEIHALPQTPGLYQIYGSSPIYGVETLLYIGKAENLYQRLNAHQKNEESFITRQPNKSIRFCEISEPFLSVAEQILIVMQKPSFNSSCIIHIGEVAKAKFYYLQNHGERGMLNLEVTNFYFLKSDIQDFF